jgi:hypothetical protein
MIDYITQTRFNAIHLDAKRSRERDLHPDDRKSPDVLQVSKHLIFDLRF